jgi:hypothetical protein
LHSFSNLHAKGKVYDTVIVLSISDGGVQYAMLPSAPPLHCRLPRSFIPILLLVKHYFPHSGNRQLASKPEAEPQDADLARNSIL